MNYEEKYKEALAKLQEALAPCEDGCKISGLTRDCLENIFPELKESEDERIKDEILRLVSISGNGNQYEEIRDWIEKLNDKDALIKSQHELIKELGEYKTKYVRDSITKSLFLNCYCPDGICLNPLRDCINCPRRSFGTNTVSTYTTTNTTEDKQVMSEDYCSFELSELLREKGFDGLCHRYDFEDWRGRHTDTVAKYPNNFNKDNGSTSIPTHQMAMKWLREKGIRVCIDYNNMSGDWYATIAKEYDGQMSERIRSEHFTLYEEAVEAALKYVLENLI